MIIPLASKAAADRYPKLPRRTGREWRKHKGNKEDLPAKGKQSALPKIGYASFVTRWYTSKLVGYTASDLRAVGVGFLLFGLFAFAPGYTFGWLSNVLQFRQRRLITRLTAAVPLSIGLVPSLQRPGGNLTGIFGFPSDIAATWVTMLHQMVGIG